MISVGFFVAQCIIRTYLYVLISLNLYTAAWEFSAFLSFINLEMYQIGVASRQVDSVSATE